MNYKLAVMVGWSMLYNSYWLDTHIASGHIGTLRSLSAWVGAIGNEPNTENIDWQPKVLAWNNLKSSSELIAWWNAASKTSALIGLCVCVPVRVIENNIDPKIAQLTRNRNWKLPFLACLLFETKAAAKNAQSTRMLAIVAVGPCQLNGVVLSCVVFPSQKVVRTTHSTRGN